MPHLAPMPWVVSSLFLLLSYYTMTINTTATPCSFMTLPDTLHSSWMLLIWK